jgi:F0F1-type ATP synthase delta subunit
MPKLSAADKLHHQLATFLNATKVDKDDVAEVLISLLAMQIASYDPLIRLDVWDNAVDSLDMMVDEISEELDLKYSNN